MCKIQDYPDWYFRADGILREEGINPLVPGYELLRRAMIIYRVDGPGPDFLEQVTKGLVLPTNWFRGQKREPEEQWMVEAMKMQNINTPLMEYIGTLANRL